MTGQLGILRQVIGDPLRVGHPGGRAGDDPELALPEAHDGEVGADPAFRREYLW